MKLNPDNPLHAALSSINASYGTGYMCEVHYNPGRQIGHYVTVRQYGCGVYAWHIIRGRVYARGTSRRIKGGE